MHYVEVLVAEQSYHGKESLTYSSKEPLRVGSVVTVPLRSKQVLGIVAGNTTKRAFAVKEIAMVWDVLPLPAQQLHLLQWMHVYYPAPLGIITQHFLPRALPKTLPEAVATPAVPSTTQPPLTKEQEEALEKINAPGMHLLHGETGSGKTRVYVELAKRQLLLGKSSLILSPEIGLTSQLVKDFQHVFGKDRIVLIHSQLGDSVRRKLWVRILSAEQPLIVIGARSALFSPLRSIGLIVVDESHETAYKQDQAPYYHASTVAAKLADLHKATLVLGSATPLINDYYIATAKNRPIVRMEQKAVTTDKSDNPIAVVDLRDKNAFSRSPYLSDELLEAAQATLLRKEQVLLFLNRRGTAHVVFCNLCGWQALCPHCDLPLVYHGDSHTIRCHSCNYKNASPSNCPDCGNPSIIFTSVGTKAIAEEARRLFPGATIKRFDTDNKKSDRIEAQFDLVHSGEVDILVGTQTLAKGLDLPKLGLVGVVGADTSLFLPDFSAQERTYQLLTQVIGRVGRGHRASHAILQTYAPDSDLLQNVLTKNWYKFYNDELDERRRFLFPPFCYLLLLTCKRSTRTAAEQAAKLLAEKLKAHNVIVEGPTPAFREKNKNTYQWQLVVKAKRRPELLDIINTLPANWSYDIDPLNLL